MGCEVLSRNVEDRVPGTPYGSSATARTFVAELKEKCRFDDPAARRMAEFLGELLDELAECREVLLRDGQIVRDRFGKPKAHPATQREIALLNEFGKTFRLLGLDQAPPQEQGKLGF